MLWRFSSAATAAGAGTVTGTVRNGTTGKPAASVEMILIQLQGGMQPVANTKTDAEGHYKFDNPSLGAAPMLLRAVYRGVNYHEPVTPGQDHGRRAGFEPTDKPSAFAVTAHAIILQPDGSDLDVGEEYNITNKTQPPLAYYRADGSFLFSLPAGAQLNRRFRRELRGHAGDSDPDRQREEQGSHRVCRFAPATAACACPTSCLTRAIRPSSPSSLPMRPSASAIFVPPTCRFRATGLSPAGQEQGFNVYMRESVAANTPFTVSVSGTAPPPPARRHGGADAPGGGSLRRIPR